MCVCVDAVIRAKMRTPAATYRKSIGGRQRDGSGAAAGESLQPNLIKAAVCVLAQMLNFLSQLHFLISRRPGK